MKIIAGTLKGRTIRTVFDNTYRPMTGAVKEALFSILSSGQFTNEKTGKTVLEGAIIVDLFGGTGALTFESISRGARQGIIIEMNPVNIKNLEANTRNLGVSDCVQIIKGDAKNLPAPPEKCSIAFLDPPFDKELIEVPVQELVSKGWLTKDALIVIESHEKEKYDISHLCELIFSRQYGKAVVSIYTITQ